MLRRVTLMLTVAAITGVVLVLEAGSAPAAPKTGGTETERPPIQCKSGKVCHGTRYDDVIYGSPGNDNIRPDEGNDTIYAGAGNDAVGHSYGNDYIEGGPGADTVRGGFDDDTIYGNRPGSPDPDTGLPTDVFDGARDLVDCAWLASRGDTGQTDVGYGEQTDTVVDCSNRDDQ